MLTIATHQNDSEVIRFIWSNQFTNVTRSLFDSTIFVYDQLYENKGMNELKGGK